MAWQGCIVVVRDTWLLGFDISDSSATQHATFALLLQVVESRVAAGDASSSEALQQQHAELQQLRTACTAAQESERQWQQELADTRKQLDVVQQQKADVQSAVDGLTLQLQQTHQELSALQHAVGQLQELQEQHAAAELQLLDLQGAHKEAEAAAAAAQQQLNEAMAERQAAEKAIGSVQAQLETLQLQLLNTHQQSQEALFGQQSSTRAAAEQHMRLQHVNEAVTAAEQANGRAQHQLQQVQEACTLAEGQKSELLKQVAGLDAQREVLKGSCSDLAQQQQQLHEQIEVMQQALAAAHSQQPAAAVASPEELDALRAQAALAEQLQVEVQSLRQELQELEQLHQQNMEVAAAAGFTTSISVDPNTPARSRDHLKWEISSLGDELKAAEQRRKVAEQLVNTKEKELEELREHVASLQLQLQEVVKRQGPGASYATVLKGDDAAGDSLDELKLQHLHQQLAELQAKASADVAEIERLSSLLAAAGQSTSPPAELQDAQQQKHAALEAAQQLQQQVEHLSAECTALRQVAAGATRQQEQQQAAQQQIQELQQQVQQLSAEHKALKETAGQQHAATSAGEAAMADLQAALKAAERDIQQLQESLRAEQECKLVLEGQVCAGMP